MKTTILKPSYYDNFSCIGSECKYTCCQEWAIFLSKKDYLHIKNYKKPKEIENLCKKSIRRIKKEESNEKYASIEFNQDRQCMLLTEDQLCSLQQSCGPSAIPYICKNFPRSNVCTITEDHQLLEQYLSLGCEAVVKQILDLPEGIDFISSVADKKKEFPINYLNSLENAKERPIYQDSWEIKTLGVDILQNRSLSLEDRLLLLGLALQSIHQMETDWKLEEVLGYIQNFHAMMEDSSALMDILDIQVDSSIKLFNAISTFEKICERKQNLAPIRHDVYENLGVTVSELDFDINCPENNIKNNVKCDIVKYEAAKKQLDTLLQGREYILENILVTYFLYNNYPFYRKDGTIWDHYLFFVSIYNFLMFFLMGYLTEKSTEEDLVYAVTLCSRQIAHSNILFHFVTNKLKETQSDTLGHMAILIK